MRITLNMLTDNVLSNLMANTERLLEAQDKVSSGKRIHRPSDDVPGIGRSLSLRSGIASLEQFDRNSNIAAHQLAVTSSALDAIVKALESVRTLAVGAASSVLTDEARAGIVSQLGRIKEELESIGNTQYLGKYIFSGSLSSTKPFVETGGDPPYSYQGDSLQFTVQIGSGIYIPASVTGDKLFNMGSSAVPGMPDVFAMIKSLTDNVIAGDVTTISNQLTEIDANLHNVIGIRSQVGGWLNRLESTNEVLLNSKVKIMDLLSKVEDVDLAEAVVELRTRENVYQAAIASASRVLQISLADFLG